MKAAEEHLLIFEGTGAGQHVAAGAAWVDLPQANPLGRASRERASQYPQRSRPSEQRRKNRQMASALWVAEIQAKGHKAFGFVAWHGGQLCWLGALLARPLLRIRYGSPCGDARAKPPCPRPVLPATASMRFNQRFPNVRRSDQADRRGSSRPCCWRQASCHRGWSR